MPPQEINIELKSLNTPGKCIWSETPTLGELQRTHGEELTEGYICVWLAFIQDMAGVKNKMNNNQIQLCSQMVLEKYKFLKIADLNLISKIVIRGDFGQFFENISIPKVLDWFNQYSEQRSEEARMISNHYNETGQTEVNAKETVKLLVEMGVINQEMIDSIGNSKNKEEDFRKFSAEYHAKKLIENNDKTE